MGVQYRLTTTIIEDLTMELRPEQMAGPEQSEIRATRLPAEWERQSGVQLTWPHGGTDWKPILGEVTECYVRMALEIATRERLVVVTPEPDAVNRLLRERLPSRLLPNITLCEAPTNDTWARDHGFITLQTSMGCLLLDFQFNGWGQKFPADLDNQICRRMMEQGVLDGQYEDHLDFVLEGGSIESDGKGTLLTTSRCLLARNGNVSGGKQTPPLPLPLEGRGVVSGGKSEIEERLKRYLHAERVLWLDYGYLAGDDTDSHIDTLARFCPNDTIAYVQCTNKEDEHYEELKRMEAQLREFRTLDGRPYRLLPLPMAKTQYEKMREGENEKMREGENEKMREGENEKMREGENEKMREGENEKMREGENEKMRKGENEKMREGENERMREGENERMREGENEKMRGERLPATYANFLCVNGAVLMPTYGDAERDERARRQLQSAFPKHEVVPIDCRVLIEQHGSLHCCTMQFPQGVIRG